MTALPPYLHKPISNNNSIRLLRLRAASDDLHSIECELFEAPLRDGYEDEDERTGLLEDYEAISWCWGQLLKDRVLKIFDGEQAYSFFISPHLEAALRRLRRKDTTRVLWVDAICINQIDKIEQSQQVQKMDQVYGQAKEVCIWLGQEDETSHEAIKFIKEKILDIWDFDKLRESGADGHRWQALTTLMRRPWFSRRWIVQEVALARRAVLYCGTDCIRWRDFADAVSLLIKAESALQKLPSATRDDDSSRAVRGFYEAFASLGAVILTGATSDLFRNSESDEDISLRERRLGLEYLVSRYTVFRASDPRDTIYALLAIAKDTQSRIFDQNLPEEFRNLPGEAQRRLSCWLPSWSGKGPLRAFDINYEKSPIEVYKDFVAFSICHSDPRCALNILCRPWAPPMATERKRIALASDAAMSKEILPSRDPALPSWIPQLPEARFVDRGSSAIPEKIASSLVGMPGDRIYSASGLKPVSFDKLKWTNRNGHYSMSVEGFVVTTIRKLGEAAICGVLPSKWLRLGKFDPIKGEDPPEDLWRTLIADRSLDGKNAENLWARICKEALSRPPDDELTQSGVLFNRASLMNEYMQRFGDVITDRRLIRTAGGDLGLVHKNAKVGDTVCILFGCTVPVLLRRHEKSESDLDADRAEAKIEQERRYQEAKPQSTAKGQLRENDESWSYLETHEQKLKDERSIFLAFMAFSCLCALLAVVEHQSQISIQMAALANSLLFVLPLEYLVPQNGPSTGKWLLRYARTTSTVLLAVHVVSWPRHLLVTSWMIGITLTLTYYVLWTRTNNSWTILYARTHFSRVLRLLINFCQLLGPTSTLKPATKLPKPPLIEPSAFYWEIIGECYVNGIMDGEAIRELERIHQPTAPQVFELR